MSRVTFTEDEREVMWECVPRQLLIVRKLATLINPESLDQKVEIANLVGKDFSEFDKKRVGLLLKNLKKMFEDFLIGDKFYAMRFNAVSLSYIQKVALQEQERIFRGNGSLYAEAALALKQKMGVQTDVHYLYQHGHENFNFGESVRYLDPAFTGLWRMNFVNYPRKGMRQNVEIRPNRSALEIYQVLFHKTCAGEFRDVNELGLIPMNDFIDPKKWERISDELAKKALKFIADRIERQK